jgi:thiol-disulfide isomerase/thioredoxin
VTKISILVAGLAFLGSSLLGDDLEALRKAPELKFIVPSEGQKTLSQYEGNVVALEFIFTTCPHCKAASHLMTKLQQEYGPRGFQVIDVAVNPNSDLLVDDFAKEQQVNFPVGWTQSDTMTTFMGFSPGRYVVPQLVLIDRKGFIHYQTPATEDEKWDRMMKEETIRRHIEQLLSAKGSGNKSEGLSSQARGGSKGR